MFTPARYVAAKVSSVPGVCTQRFWRFLKFGRQRVDINSSFVHHCTVNLRRMPEVNYAHGEIQTNIAAVHFTSFLRLRPANRANKC